MSIKAFVDTEVLAKKRPVREKFKSSKDYEKALKFTKAVESSLKRNLIN